MASVTQDSASAWLRSPIFDVLFIAFCWTPLYVWFVFGMGIGRDAFFGPAISSLETAKALAICIPVVLGITFIHRHYTFLYAYGDSERFRAHAKGLVIGPLIIVSALYAAYHYGQTSVFGTGFTPWIILLTISGTWNVWHTVQQRFGILRAYGRISHSSLGDRTSGRWDRSLVWSAVLWVAVCLPRFRAETFSAHRAADRVYRQLAPIVTHSYYTVAVVLVSLFFLAVFAGWVKREARVGSSRFLPRWIFLASTFALLGVFMLHGPIVGYLCFGSAHAIEYLAFVHHVGEKHYRGKERTSLASLAFRNLKLGAPLLIFAFGGLYIWANEGPKTGLFIGYYLAGSMAHFLIDGWIWRSPRKATS